MSGEPGVEIDTGKVKIGDGVASWSSLPYFLNETASAALIQAMIDTSVTDDQILILTADGILSAPADPGSGPIKLMLEIVQDATGGWDLLLDGAILDPNNYYDGVSTDPGSSSFLGLRWSESQSAWCLLAFTKNF